MAKALAKEMPERATKMRKRLDKWLKDSGAKFSQVSISRTKNHPLHERTTNLTK